MKKGKVIGITIATLLGLFVGIPLFLEHLIFQNNVYSVLTNGEWGSFLGSYIGGIFGGVGTLIALYVSTNETRKVQDENLNQLKEDRSLDSKKERKQFADGIAQDISVYITDISKYFYDCRNIGYLNSEKYNTNFHLNNLQHNIQSKYNQKKKLNIEQDINKYCLIEAEIEQLTKEETDTKYKLQRIEEKIKNNQANRTLANERYFVLQIKLKDIEMAQMLLKQLDFIHQNSVNVGGTTLDFIDEEGKKLLDMTVTFINEYVNQATS